MYSPSVFSLKKTQSMPSAGIRTGLTLAKRSKALRMAMFALSMFGTPLPSSGVVVGPFSRTWHFLDLRTARRREAPALA